jgi:type II secretory pathway pseudopilin PulG
LRLPRNNDGITLIELIISMAITAIVLSMIVLLINTATHSFRRTNENVNLQLEAQVTMNQLSTLVMEAGSIEDSTTGTETGDIKYLLVNSSDCYAVFFRESEKKLYLIQKDTKVLADEVNPTINDEAQNTYLLAEYVSDIEIDHSKDGIAVIKIVFQLGEEPPYTANKKVMLRNLQ